MALSDYNSLTRYPTRADGYGGEYWTFYYDRVPTSQLASVLPLVGSLKIGETGGIAGLRVNKINVPYDRSGTIVDISIVYFKPIAYPSGWTGTDFLEIIGSRKTSPGERGTTTYVVGVCTSPTGTGVPVRGDVFTGDTGLLSRICVTDPAQDPDLIPGLYVVTASFYKPHAYTGGINVTNFIEIVGSRQDQDQQGGTITPVVGVCTDPTLTGVPKKGDVFTGDTAMLSRICIGRTLDRSSIPGRVIVTANYYVPTAFAGANAISTATFIEIVGSRRNGSSWSNKRGTVVGVCTDIAGAGVPASGATFPGDTGDLVRVRSGTSEDWDSYPGRCVLTLNYNGDIGQNA